MHRIKIHHRVTKKLKKLLLKGYQKISKAVYQLAKTGQSPQMKKLNGQHFGSYRLRIGN